jgi:centromere protein X
LLHELFTDDGTRISKGVDRVVGKFMETFVREAIARAAFERQGENVRVGGGFMEVCVNM